MIGAPLDVFGWRLDGHRKVLIVVEFFCQILLLLVLCTFRLPSQPIVALADTQGAVFVPSPFRQPRRNCNPDP